MNHEALRLVIQRKLQAGRLPYDTITKAWGSPSDGETCDACDTVLSKEQLLMEGTTRQRRSLQFHVQCFKLWDEERRTARAQTA